MDEITKSLVLVYEEAMKGPVSTRDMRLIEAAQKAGEITPENFAASLEFCIPREKTNINYILAVAKNWDETKEKMQNTANAASSSLPLSEFPHQEDYRKIFYELGFNRSTTPGDREIMDRWLDEWGFSIEEVVEACRKTAGIREPSLRYVNKVLENSKGRNSNNRENAIPKSQLFEYLAYIQDAAKKAQQERESMIIAGYPKIGALIQQDKALREKLLSFDKETRQKAREEKKRIQEDLRQSLMGAGYPEDYLNVQYKCTICRDTGTTKEGKTCACIPERIKEAGAWIAGKRDSTKE